MKCQQQKPGSQAHSAGEAQIRGIASSKSLTLTLNAAHLQGEPSGRLLAYEPLTGTTRVLLDQIWASNGVALAQDEASVVVSSTNTACLLQYWLTGSKVRVYDRLCSDAAC